MNQQEQPVMTAVADDVFAWVQPDGSWWVNNAGAVATADGVILVDTCATERRTRALLAAVDQATGGAPVTYLVNTHLHGDHTYGNSLLPESSTASTTSPRNTWWVAPYSESQEPRHRGKLGRRRGTEGQAGGRYTDQVLHVAAV